MHRKRNKKNNFPPIYKKSGNNIFFFFWQILSNIFKVDYLMKGKAYLVGSQLHSILLSSFLPLYQSHFTANQADQVVGSMS